MESFRTALRNLWEDVDRRRALMLSVVAHLCVLLLFILWVSRQQPVPLEQFLVIDLGTPEQAEQTVQAPAVSDPAPPAPRSEVGDETSGEPQARAAERTETVAPETRDFTQQPEPSPQQPAVPPEVAEQPEEAEENPPQAQQPPEAPPQEVATESGDAPVAPAPQVRVPEPQPPADLPIDTTAAVLPEVDEVELAPRPAEQAIRIPEPQAVARVPESRSVAVTPTVEVAAPQDVPAPDVSVQVAAAAPVPQPQASVRVPGPVPVPQPQAAASVAEATAVPLPQATVGVAQSQPVPQPQVAAEVAGASAVPVPAAAAQVTPTIAVPQPAALAQVPEARPIEVAAEVVVGRPAAVPTPSVRAEVDGPLTELGAAMAGAAPAGQSNNPSNRLEDRTEGGDARRTAQDLSEEDAQAGNPGRATDVEPGEGDGAQSFRPRIPYQEERERPLAVLLDNAAGYPQAGLTQASRVAEMPVEGGMTRLMAMYDLVDPDEVGPIRSARDYFVELAQDYDGILVHDGGSPAAMAAIERGTLPTLNAYSFGNLFSRQQGRQAPYNLFSSGNSLRDAVNRLRLDRSLEMRGVVPRPPEEAPEAQSVEVRFGGDYRSGFAYIRELDIYRWLRNGQTAVDHRGEPVFVEAVLVARIDARPIPDDPAGRLYIPLRGGEATLHLRGKAIEGRWTPAQSQGQGVNFVRADGEPMDLAPFRIWMLFAPTYAQVAVD